MTKPHPKLLEEDISKAQALELINTVSPMIEELRNYATQAFVRCKSAGTGTDEDTTVFFMYLHVIEMSDGVLVLLRECCCEPALPLLRSMFEVFVAIEYIMASEDELIYSRRVKSWLYLDNIKEIRRLKTFDENTQSDPKLKRTLKETREREGYVTDYAGAIEKRENYLNSEEMREIKEEYERTCNIIKRKQCEWFQMFDGPNDLRAMTRVIGHEGLHAFFYANWTRIAHGGYHRRYISSIEPETIVLRHLREWDGMMSYARWTCIFLLRTTDLFIHRFRKDELHEQSGYAKWYGKMYTRIDKIDWSGDSVA